MDIRKRSDFVDHDAWLSYVRCHVPVAERAYALACGRTELYKNFYELRNQTFPSEFSQELERIHSLGELEQSYKLDRLNARILADLTELLFNEIPSKAFTADAVAPASSREEIQELLDHLAKKNPYFALWTVYKDGIEGSVKLEDWQEYLSLELGKDTEDELEFTLAMAELERLLLLFQDRNQPLPRLSFERTWFLHHLRPPERMLQTRAVLHMLTAEMASCISA